MKKIISILLLLIMLLGMTSCTGGGISIGNEDGTQDGTQDGSGNGDSTGGEGELGVALYFTAATCDPSSESTVWAKKYKNTIINGGYNSFMPGEYLAFHVMVKNESSLLMKYELELANADGFSDLVNTLDVYYIHIPDGPLEGADLTSENMIGTLGDVLEKGSLTNGAIAPEDSFNFTIAIKMNEATSNIFANMALGADLRLNVTYEVFKSEEDTKPGDGSIDFPGVDF